MALTKVTGQVINDTTGLVVGVTTVGGGISATDGFFSGIVTAVGDASFSGNVSVGGTLTYEDVTNIDAVGLVTARNGIVVGSGITLSKDGDGFFTGVVTATSYNGDGSNLTGIDLSAVTGATGNFSIADKIIHTGDTDTAIRFPSADTIQLETAGSERFRIESGKSYFVGDSSGGFNSTSLPNGNTININTKVSNDGLSVIRYSSSYAAYGLNIGRSKSETLGTNSIVANGDDLGHITWYGADGTDFNQSAVISAQVDGTPSDGTDMPGRLIFKTAADGSGTPAERFRIDSSGNATISDGNLVFGTAGNGIDFSAQSGAASGMASELLDHYEEGTWTPEISFGNTTTGQVYGGQIGRYTRVGNRCFVTCYVYFTNKGSSTGTARVGGLPFTVANITSFYQHGSVWANNINFGNTVPTGYGEINTTTFRLERQNASNSSGVFTCDHTNFNNNSDLMLSFHYQVQ